MDINQESKPNLFTYDGKKEFRVNRPNKKRYRTLKRVLSFTLALFLLLTLLLFALEGISLGFFMFLGASWLVYGMLLFAQVLRDPTDLTIIHLDNKQLIRSGPGLKRACIELASIGTIYEDRQGLYVLKSGLNTSISFFSSDMRKIQEKNIIFIPKEMDDFEHIKRFIIGQCDPQINTT